MLKQICKIIIVFSSLLIPLSFNLKGFDISPSVSYALEYGNCDAGNPATYGDCLASGILNVYELLIFYTTQVLLVLVGLIFDAFLSFSLDSNFYQSGMIEAGWDILLDFTNINERIKIVSLPVIIAFFGRIRLC